MHPIRHALWGLLGLATLPVSSTASMFEVDVVFPRNATYGPSRNFPVVLAIKNAALAKNLQLSLRSSVWNGTKFREHSLGTPQPWSYDLDILLTRANVSSDEPFLLQAYHVNLATEGQHGFVLWWDYAACNDNIGSPPEGSNGDMTQANDPFLWHSSDDDSVNVWFTIKKDAPEVDLVAATSDERACLAQPKAQPGFTISLSGQTREYPAFTPGGSTIGRKAGTCEVQPDVSITNATPCRLSIDAAASASMAAALRDEQCRSAAPPADCPKPKPNGARQPLAAAMVASLTSALGVAGFLLI